MNITRQTNRERPAPGEPITIDTITRDPIDTISR
jgi:hypothetical protein